MSQYGGAEMDSPMTRFALVSQKEKLFSGGGAIPPAYFSRKYAGRSVVANMLPAYFCHKGRLQLSCPNIDGC